MTLLSAPVIASTTAATTQEMVPTAIKISAVLLFESVALMKEAYSRWR